MSSLVLILLIEIFTRSIPFLNHFSTTLTNPETFSQFFACLYLFLPHLAHRLNP